MFILSQKFFQSINSYAKLYKYAKNAYYGFEDEPPYTIIKTEVPMTLLPEPIIVDRDISAYVIPNESLPTLTPAVLASMPIPGGG